MSALLLRTVLGCVSISIAPRSGLMPSPRPSPVDPSPCVMLVGWENPPEGDPTILCDGVCVDESESCWLETTWFGPPWNMNQHICRCTDDEELGACAGVAEYYPSTQTWDFYCEPVQCLQTCYATIYTLWVGPLCDCN